MRQGQLDCQCFILFFFFNELMLRVLVTAELPDLTKFRMRLTLLNVAFLRHVMVFCLIKSDVLTDATYHFPSS